MNKIILILSGLFFLLSYCSFKPSGEYVITISGSDTMYELNESLAKEFMIDNPGISVYVKGGGTKLGIIDLIKNRTDICASSRNLKPEESKLLVEYYGSLALVYLIAKDGLSIYVNPNNIINDLSVEQIKKIFTGRIRNWKEFGGKDTLIVPVLRNPNSGTYLYFKEHVLDDEQYTKNGLTLPTTKEIIKFISENVNAIGYGGVGYKEGIVQIRVEGIYPTEENIRNDSYPITRYLHFFVSKNPSGNVKKFIDWTLSPKGQSVIRKAGFIPLWDYAL
ncbi:ABC-type phosphate transport system periplasmic component [Ignavibacterium album JCM 16511]|uniref:Phosphate-binding protein n=1 Tax=Ignavibacterium album (strain DSM 19864 / JCM 16511 / NBRC 101810 / Mat9-16) TaxID=945713 RepID=I0AJR3_IGNAJ|nr:phosphate ABC transporter substrate-binding protein [Ignavibacterium album]AFH49220.1 ABC-type phosphate transport system periplasmic component [Ignavibacterium album JCM 16511]